MARMSRRADGRFVVKVTTPDGPRYAYGKTQTAARAKAQEMRDRLEAGEPVRDATRTLSDWVGEWQDTFLAASSRSAKTQEMHRMFLRNWIVPTIGDVALDKLKPADVVRLINTMQDAGRSNNTRRNCYNALRAALDDAVVEGLLATNVVHRVPRPKCPTKEARHLETEQVPTFVKALDGLRYADALRLILLTGLRRGEALALRWQDIDLERREARVNGSLGIVAGRAVLTAPKTAGSRRVVSLSASAVSLLKSVKARQNAERLVASNQWADSGLVFTNALGGHVQPNHVLREVKIAQRKAALPDIGVHSLRHSYATTALLAGVPIHVVSRNLGHSSIALTSDTYGHLTDQASRDAAEVVSAAFGM